MGLACKLRSICQSGCIGCRDNKMAIDKQQRVHVWRLIDELRDEGDTELADQIECKAELICCPECFNRDRVGITITDDGYILFCIDCLPDPPKPRKGYDIFPGWGVSDSPVIIKPPPEEHPSDGVEQWTGFAAERLVYYIEKKVDMPYQVFAPGYLAALLKCETFHGARVQAEEHLFMPNHWKINYDVEQAAWLGKEYIPPWHNGEHFGTGKIKVEVIN